MQISRQYQDPSYVTRQDANLGSVAAGAAGVTSKFVAFAAMQLFSLTASLQTAGTSTYTANGTATINGQQLNVIIITNTATGTGSVALATTTYGPYLAGGGYNSGNGTGTAQVGGINQWVLNTNTGTAQLGGVPVPTASVVYVVSGTDATAVSAVTLDYQVTTGAGLTA
jgi:hypothetical protein